MSPPTSPDHRRSAPAVARNLEPLHERLGPVLPSEGPVLEIACGTGEHCVNFASRHPNNEFQPCDPDDAARESTDAWVMHAGLRHVRPALPVDVMEPDWWIRCPEDRYAAAYCVNMIHIAPWRACEGLMRGVGELLEPGAPVVLYGPFLRTGIETAESNIAFDQSLRSRNPEWGVRALEDVQAVAAEHGLISRAVHEMPANNLCVVFERR